MSLRIFYTDTNGRRWQIDDLSHATKIKYHIAAIRVEDNLPVVVPTASVKVER